MSLSTSFTSRVGLRGRAAHSCARLLRALFMLVLASPAWAATPPAVGHRAMRPAPMWAGQPLAEVLNPNGTLKAGLRGSFNPQGYTMGTDAATGQPAFRPAARRTLGVGDENWQDSFGLPGTNGMGMNGVVWALAVDASGSVYAGGQFTTAGGAAANRIARWNGTAWSALGSGMNGDVRALAVDGVGNVYAGGSFSVAGGLAAENVAKWDGTTWGALGMGMNSYVSTLAVDGGGNVYAGGNFTVAGGVPADRVAKWNGTAWSTLGTGMSGTFNPVLALAVDASGNVYAGGYFTTAGGAAANRVAKWNGTAWSALGTGMSDGVEALAVDGSGNVYAGGAFTRAGGAAANYVAKWNGTTWSALGTGVSFAPQLYAHIYALAVDGSGNVYAGGQFVTAGSAAANYVAKWNGTAWSTLGTGLNGFVQALAVRNGQVCAGGQFTTVGDGSKVTAYFGIYHPNGVLATASAVLAAQVALYPNPARKRVSVELPAALRRQAATATLMDGQGRVVLLHVLPTGLATHTLPLANVATGVYSLRLQTTAGSVVKKLVVE